MARPVPGHSNINQAAIGVRHASPGICGVAGGPDGAWRNNTATLWCSYRSRTNLSAYRTRWFRVVFSSSPAATINGLIRRLPWRLNKASCYLTHDIVPADGDGSTERAVWVYIMKDE
jgi:hypothetical protein